MTNKWTGFTDEELKAMSVNTNKPALARASQVEAKRTLKHSNLSASTQRVKPSERPSTAATQPLTLSKQRVSKVQEDAPVTSGKSAEPQNCQQQGPVSLEHEVKPAVNSGGAVTELDEQTVIQREMTSLETFQKQQKMIEELNKQKKKLLNEAINERQQQAVQESSRLRHVQQQLQQLEQALTADVSLLRERIEQAALSYTQAQKRFELAEREYVSAKLHLQRVADNKEALTEHLYTIIYQSELRKSAKLSELAQQLGLAAEESSDITVSGMPNLALFTTSPSYKPRRESSDTPVKGTEIATCDQVSDTTLTAKQPTDSSLTNPSEEKVHSVSEENTSSTADTASTEALASGKSPNGSVPGKSLEETSTSCDDSINKSSIQVDQETTGRHVSDETSIAANPELEEPKKEDSSTLTGSWKPAHLFESS